ncbi:MAG: membrane protein insertion efficiency factor YidD [Rhizomicrobium sp.]
MNGTTRTLRGWAAAALIAPIRVYRTVLSPLFPPACRFQPTCSQYAIEAIQVHGPLKGLGLAIRRLARCHPISWLGGSSGFDPVPPR